MKLKTNLKYTSRKTIALLIIVAFLLPSFSLIITVAAEEQTFQNITVDTAYNMIKKENKYPNLIILDVRTPYEYKKGHLYDAILIPYDGLEKRISEIEDHVNHEIIIYCKAGDMSQLASEILVNYGFTKINNMLGGILAWIDVKYPIWTTYHYVTVDGIEKPKLQIEPLLLYLTGCPCCTSNQECPDNSESITITSTVLEQDDNHIVILLTYEFDGITYEFTIINTLLWSYNEITNEIKRTASFISSEIITGDTSTQFYELNYLAQHEEYNLTFYTRLTSLNSEIYNGSSTILRYIPADEKSITSMEIVKFNSPVKLSQQYHIIGEVAKELGEVYKYSEDDSLKDFSNNYKVMNKEAEELSYLVKKCLSEYDLPIQQNSVIIIDAYTPNGGGGGGLLGGGGCFGGDPFWDCVLCELAVAAGGFIACVLLIIFVPGAGAFCILVLEYFLMTGSTYIACQMAGCC